ncbi:MAG: GNAT family N-acetyltransferase [Rhodobacteraceae bacterium]|nr:GNAT family N-acetyltransferase [Paracoccaceae bacterium]
MAARLIPVIETGRLTLRGPRREDFAPYAAFWASARSLHEDGPRDARAAWEDFAAAFGLWLIEGYGCWSVEDRTTGAFCGIVGMNRPVHFDEPEIGWTLVPEAEGKGIAFEAAMAARDWVYANTALTTMVSYIGPANIRSIRLAERMGAWRDASVAGPDAGDVVMRHPGPGGRA